MKINTREVSHHPQPIQSAQYVTTLQSFSSEESWTLDRPCQLSPGTAVSSDWVVDAMLQQHASVHQYRTLHVYSSTSGRTMSNHSWHMQSTLGRIFLQLIYVQKLTLSKWLTSTKNCNQSQRQRKLQNSTTSSDYLSQTNAKSEKVTVQCFPCMCS